MANIILAQILYFAVGNEILFTFFRFLRALKYTCACLFLFAIFVVMGLFIPFDSVPPRETNLTQWQIVEEIIEKNVLVDNSKADNLLVFLLNVLSCVGMIILIVYTAYGMSSLPFSLINGQRTVYTDRNSVAKEIEDLGTLIPAHVNLKNIELE